MTWYQSQNYGTVLQAYALQRTLRSVGADAQLVNYDPAPWQQRNHSFLRRSRPFRAARVLQQSLMGEAPFVSREKSAAFKAFSSSHLIETEPVTSPADFAGLNSCFDAFVCGSDQVWSPRCYDPRYYLDFVSDGIPRIAYAPSFGCDALPGEFAASIARLVARFDALSAREAEGARIAEQLSGKFCEVVCDPVVLLTADEWRAVFSAPGTSPLQVSGDYCLCYFLGRSGENWFRARSIAKDKGLNLVIIPVFNGDMRRSGAVPFGVGPLEFLRLIDGASYVCTDSFHGLVFSTIFKRDFSVFERFKPGSPSSQNVRIENYLCMTGLEHRLLSWGDQDVDNDSYRIDYTLADKNIGLLRSSSLAYLKHALAPVLFKD